MQVRRDSKFKRALCLLAVAGVGIPIAATPAPAEASPGPTIEAEFDTHNLDLVVGLDDFGRCLFNREVFPAGSIGPGGSEQPYDVIEDRGDRALNIFRSEVLRNHSSVVAEVFSTRGATPDQSTVVIQVSKSSDLTTGSFEDSSQTSEASAAAFSELSALGASFIVAATASGSIADFCQVEQTISAVASLPASDGSALFRSYDPAIGKLRLRVENWDRRLGEYLEANFGDLAEVDYAQVGANFELTSRSTGVPAAGGSYYVSDGRLCSTGFRLGTGSMVTAAHCNWTPGRNAYSQSGSNYLGSFRSSLYNAVSIDIQVLARSAPYSASIYVGPGVQNGDSSSRIAANGVYPTHLLTAGDSLLVSGGRTGQGSADFYSGVGCMILWEPTGTPFQACQLMSLFVPGDVVMGGDSGGPVAAYDPSNGRVIAAGIINGIWRPFPGATGELYATTMMAVNYLYGYPGVG